MNIVEKIIENNQKFSYNEASSKLRKHYLLYYDLEFKYKIKGLAYIGKDLNILLKNNKKNKKIWKYCSIKNENKHETRHYNLARAFLSNVSYLTLEKKTRKNNQPNINKIFIIIQNHFGKSKIQYLGGKDVIETAIKQWVNNE